MTTAWVIEPQIPGEAFMVVLFQKEIVFAAEFADRLCQRSKPRLLLG
jgi:hypothetical protein